MSPTTHRHPHPHDLCIRILEACNADCSMCGFARTRDLLERTLCVPLSPELPQEQRAVAVKAIRRVLEAM
ncbi:hypothetical protein [Streptomyces sp. CBMA123]|uniref:hypothetical protein n=1 Tax=Streptomyces sp. CBMA123 TaxID=1896313 RepID=UPI001CB7BA62|nr:hypothetical protein [Streptomyces sp. CBMA123]MBD0692115.1 hypothetical protein [Streptomyces sp. CBMA123]